MGVSHDGEYTKEARGIRGRLETADLFSSLDVVLPRGTALLCCRQLPNLRIMSLPHTCIPRAFRLLWACLLLLLVAGKRLLFPISTCKTPLRQLSRGKPAVGRGFEATMYSSGSFRKSEIRS